MDNIRDDLTPAERLVKRLSAFKGRVVRVTVTISQEGQPEIGAIENLGRAERFGKERSGLDYTPKPG